MGSDNNQVITQVSFWGGDVCSVGVDSDPCVFTRTTLLRFPCQTPRALIVSVLLHLLQLCIFTCVRHVFRVPRPESLVSLAKRNQTSSLNLGEQCNVIRTLCLLSCQWRDPRLKYSDLCILGKRIMKDEKKTIELVTF